MDTYDQILKLEGRFQGKYDLIIEFFNQKISTEDSPKVMEIYQYSLNCFLESMECAEERIMSAKTPNDRLRVVIDRDLYLDYVIGSNGIKAKTDEYENKSVK